jgi:hypothetical protein
MFTELDNRISSKEIINAIASLKNIYLKCVNQWWNNCPSLDGIFMECFKNQVGQKLTRLTIMILKPIETILRPINYFNLLMRQSCSNQWLAKFY